MNPIHRMSSEEWAAIFSDHEHSGLSVKRFCLQRGIKPTSFHSAQKRKDILLVKASVDACKVTPADRRHLQPAAAHAIASHRAGFVGIHVREQSRAKMPLVASAIRVQLRGGHQLWVDSDFDATHLRSLVAVLESAS